MYSVDYKPKLDTIRDAIFIEIRDFENYAAHHEDNQKAIDEREREMKATIQRYIEIDRMHVCKICQPK